MTGRTRGGVQHLMVCAEAIKHGCIDTNNQDRWKFGANKCQYHSTTLLSVDF